MKKFIFTGILLTSMLFPAFGQVLINETFEDYVAGAKLVQAAQSMGHMYWSSWNAYNAAEDATIVTEQAQGGTKSAKFVVDNDVVLLLNNQVSGAYKVEFKMYVPSGQTGYFNVLHKPPVNGAGQEWAAEIYFNSTGIISIKADQNVDNIGSFSHATWMNIELVFDLDEDVTAFSVNGAQLRTWQFSLKPGNSGGEQGTKQLGGMDFYGGSSSTPYSFYIDNVVYTQTSEPLPLPTVTFTGDIVKFLQPNSTAPVTAYLTSEEAGTQNAIWSTLIKYPDLDYGTQKNFGLAICDEYSVKHYGCYLTDNNYTVELAMRLTPNDYNTLIGGKINEIAYYVDVAPHIPIGDLTFRIYEQGKSDGEEGEVLAEKVLPLSQMMESAWNSVTLNESVKLTGGEYWIAVSFLCPPGEQGVGPYPICMDAGPAEWGGDWNRLNGGPWHRWSSGAGNLAIKANGSGKVRDAFVSVDKTFGTTKPEQSTQLVFTFKSGTYPDGEYKATLFITSNDENNPVIEAPILMKVGNAPSTNTNVSEVTVDGTIAPTSTGTYDFRIEIATDKETIEIVVTPEDPAATVTGDTGEQPVKATQQGQQNVYSFTVTAEDGETTQDYKLMVFAKLTTAISEIDNAVQLYPNPVTDYLYLKSDVAIDQVTIYNLTGKVVKQIEQPGLSIDLSDFASGIYMLRVSTSQGETMKKFIKE